MKWINMKNLGLILTLIFSLFTFGCSKTVEDKTTKNTIVYNMERPPRTCDPQVTTEGSAFVLLSSCMEGLVRLSNIPGEVIPGVAEKWNITDNGKIITFHLRKDAKWSNGDSITASQFHDGIIRALQPETAYAMSSILYSIKNAEEFNCGEIKDSKKVGIKVIDDYTIQFILKAPTPYFIQVLALPCAFPQDQKFFNKVKNKYALGMDKLLYNGPWITTKWIDNSGYELKKNPKYWNAANIKIDNLKFIVVEDFNTASNMYKNGSLDVTLISGNQLSLYKDSKALFRQPKGIWFLVFNTRLKMFKNIKIRKAISMAINRKVLCDSVRKDGSLPAYSYVPYGISGGNKKTYRDRFGDKLISENIPEAQKLLKEGLKEIGHKGPVNISLTIENTGTIKNDAVFIQEELRRNLGVNLELKIKTYSSRLEDYRQANYEIMFTRWGPDYNDPMTFMDMWISGETNRPGWENSVYDSYIQNAALSNDNNIRMQAMFNAEKLLLKEMPIVPLYFTCDNWLIRPNIKDIAIRPAGTGVSFYWANIKNDYRKEESKKNDT
jgi:oligopeptide transport system substrate-binding protein